MKKTKAKKVDSVHMEIIVIVLALAIGILAAFLIHRNHNNDFRQFIQAEKAGVYQGVIMSPVNNSKGMWLIEIPKTPQGNASKTPHK